MKKGLLCFLAIGLTVVGCQNYDDQFNDLNSQISALSTQVAGLSQVQTDLSTLAATVASLQSSINNNGSTFSEGLSSLQAQIDALEGQLSEVASSEDLTNVNNSLDGVKEDLEDLLSSANVFNGDLNINSIATLEFAQSLKGKVGIINGSVEIELNADMDAEELQKVMSQIKTITKDLTIRAINSSVAAISMDSLTGVNNLKVAQAGAISFPMLKSAGDITLGNNYESKLTGDINFGVLTQVKSFKTGLIASGTGFPVSDEEDNTIAFNKMSSLDLGMLVYYTPKTLIIKGDSDTSINLMSLKSIDANGKDKSYNVTVDGANELNIPGLVLGEVTVTNVKNIMLEGFSGKFNLNDGVENVTIGALKNDFDATGKNDLETINLTMNAPEKAITLTNAEGLKSVSIAGEVKSVMINNNDDLTDLDISAAIESLTINDTNLSEAILTYTNANLAEKGKLIVTGNNDLTRFSADNVDGLAELTITGNEDLATISFDGLKAVPTKAGVNPKVVIGGVGNANAFNALEIVQDGVDSNEGDFTTDSGIDDLKTYLTEAAKNAGASLKVFFDSADDFTDGTNEDTGLLISGGSTEEARLTVINRDGSSSAKKAKRAFLVTTLPANNEAGQELSINGTTINWTHGNTAADFISNLTSVSNINQAKINEVTLTGNANGSPKAMVYTANLGTTTITNVPTVTAKADAQQVKLIIGDFSSTIYLSTQSLTDFTDDTILGTDKSAESELTVVNGTTNINAVLNAIVADFNTTDSPYTLANTMMASGTLSVTAKDKSNAKHGKAIKFTAPTTLGMGSLSINQSVSEDDQLIGEDPIIIVESDTPGLTLSNIGNPRNTVDPNDTDDIAGDATTGAGKVQVDLASGTVIELYNASNDTSASPSVTNMGVDSTTGAANTNRLSWLAG